MKFRKLGISESILKVIKEEKFEEPSEIQEKCIPLVLAGKDVIAGSATGSGKTLVFGSVIIQNSEKGKRIQALILTPTRELAEQVKSNLVQLSANLKIIAVYGGVSINPQIRDLQRADVVVATPGRLLDHLERRTVNLSGLKILVLDEVDRMLDMGFIESVEKVIRASPKNRQTLFFSATIPPQIQELTKRYMNNPMKFTAKKLVDEKYLKQAYYDVERNEKLSLLCHLLNQKQGMSMVFCNTRRSVDFVVRNLRANSIQAIAIHGGLSQNKRTRTMEIFNGGKAMALVCTDVAARGLHIDNVEFIYNYEMPRDPKDYIHRIGRTARAGESGTAINLVSSSDHESFSRIMAEYRTFSIEKGQRPAVRKIFTVREQPRSESFGKRPFRRHRAGQGYPRRYSGYSGRR